MQEIVMRRPRSKGRILPWVLVGLAALGLRAGAADTNILLITVDTLRPDRLSCYSPKYVRTPSIDALAAQGVQFEKAFAHCPITLASHANILLGTTPLFHGVSDNSKAKVSPAFMTMAKHLKSLGYATGAFVGAFPLDSRFGLNQGFDVYDDAFPSRPENENFYAERRAEVVVGSALAWLGRQRGKWFCWIHVFDPHAPYDPPEPYATKFRSDPYSGEVAFVDAQLGRLFAELGKRGWPGDTLTVLTSDHGESLGEHGELTHGYFAYTSTLHVPLLIAGPGIKPGRVADDVSHVDIFPTVCDLAGLKPPAAPLQGASLRPLMAGKKQPARRIYFESLDSYLNKGCAPLRGFMENGRKFIDSPIPELYDLTKDFGEAVNLAPRTDLAPYRKTLQEMERALSAPPADGARQPVNRETIDRLKSLGYVATRISQIKASYGPEDDLKSFLPFQQKLERAIILGDQGKSEEGFRLMEELIVERKDFGSAYTYLSQAYMNRRNIRDAIRVLDTGVKINPKDYSLLSAFGTLLVKTEQWDKAAEILGKALAVVDDDPESWDNLGIVAMRQGEFPKALEYFQKAVAADGHYALAYSNMGFVHFQIYKAGKKPEDLARAIENFRKAADVNPVMNLAWRGLGVASLEAVKPDEAIAAWEKALAADPKDEFSTMSLGLEYLKKGDKARARTLFLKYVELRGPRLTADERAKVLTLLDRCR
jgi:arylsulfatase A-like enzyme/Flp pilus assembly protein TadD